MLPVIQLAILRTQSNTIQGIAFLIGLIGFKYFGK